MNFKVLIADDDAGMCKLLKKAIEKVDGFHVVGEASDGEEAFRLVEKLNPDIVFLDVEMPVLNGIECANMIVDFNPLIKIIFVTAYEEYMPEAFKVYAFDYMVKPFKMDRLYQTLQHLKNIALRQNEESTAIPGINKPELDKLLIRGKEGVILVDIDDIILIQREDRNTVIITSHEKYVTSDSLGQIEEKLGRWMFFRSHKSYIINLSKIHKIFPYGRWTYLVKLKNTDVDALMTSDKYEELRKRFK
ncbi:MAG TPA: response regulator transcription factor [Clostridiaceae bacterium]|nr:response regulator transcription factor [Clostridiaceae bacterium]